LTIIKYISVRLLLKYFPDLDDNQLKQFEKISEVYKDWNQKINVVSRKDIDEIYIRHVLHSMGIAKIQAFLPGSKVLDVGTGGGFPGIPLAILFPETEFTLVDSIGKKIKVVEEVVEELGLQNVKAINDRVENISGEFDFIVSRAVAVMPSFVHWVKGKIAKHSLHERKTVFSILKVEIYLRR